MTIEISNAWPMNALREQIRAYFPSVSQERFDALTLNLSVEDNDCDRLSDWLDALPWGCAPIKWRIV